MNLDFSTWRHFAYLVRSPTTTATSNEYAARKLAKSIIKHAPKLDAEATKGLIAFILFVQHKPATARRWFEDETAGPITDT